MKNKKEEMKNKEKMNADQSVRPKRPKSREVSSRFLSTTLTSSIGRNSLMSNRAPITPTRHKAGSSTESRKHQSLHGSEFIQTLWSSQGDDSPANRKRNLKNEREKDLHHIRNEKKGTNASLLNRQRSFRDFRCMENNGRKENHKPVVGGSMRYTRTSGFTHTSSPTACESSVSDSSSIERRLSSDEMAIRKALWLRRGSTDSKDYSLDSESSNSRHLGRSLSTSTYRGSATEVPSKFAQDKSKWAKHCSIDSNLSDTASSESCQNTSRFTFKNAIKRANTNSFRTQADTTLQRAMASSVSSLSPASGEANAKRVPVCSSKLPNGANSKRIEGLFALGFNLFRNKNSSSGSSPSRSGRGSEAIHQLRLLHNRSIQWRYANATSNAVNQNVTGHVERDLFRAQDSLEKLRHSVVHKRLQLEKEKFERKLDFVVYSQVKALEAWEGLESEHMSAVSNTKESLYSVVCRVPLIKGAKVQPESGSIALGHASVVATSTKSLLTTYMPLAEKALQYLSELAEVVAEEKSLLEQCFQYLKTVSSLEIQEGSLRCGLTQLKQPK